MWCLCLNYNACFFFEIQFGEQCLQFFLLHLFSYLCLRKERFQYVSFFFWNVGRSEKKLIKRCERHDNFITRSVTELPSWNEDSSEIERFARVIFPSVTMGTSNMLYAISSTSIVEMSINQRYKAYFDICFEYIIKQSWILSKIFEVKQNFQFWYFICTKYLYKIILC